MGPDRRVVPARSALTNIDDLFLRRRFAPANGRLGPRADRALDGNV
jgi:hypothetical protein